MDTETASVLTFLEAVANAREGMDQLSRELLGRSGIRNVRFFHDAPKRYTIPHWDEEQKSYGISIDLSVSAELIDGTIIDWSLDISCDTQGWHVEYGVDQSDPGEDGSHRVSEYPVWQGVSLQEMAAHLPTAVAELGSSADRPGFLAPREQATSTT